MISTNGRRKKNINFNVTSKVVPKKIQSKVVSECEVCTVNVDPTQCVKCFTSNVGIFYSIDYGTGELYDYARYCPNYFRYVDPFYNMTYEELFDLGINQENAFGNCLVMQLSTLPGIIGGQAEAFNSQAINMYASEVLYTLLLPTIDDTPEKIEEKDNFREIWFAFILNIEKSTIYYYQQKETCNNQIVPWDAYYSFERIYNYWADTFGVRIYFGTDFPLSQIDQVVLYTLSVNYFANQADKTNNLSGRRKVPFNPVKILGVLDGSIPLDSPELTQVNFYEWINYSYQLLSQIFSISNKLLNGLETGLPPQFIAKFYPRERQILYYNKYLTWIQSRNSYLGFGGMRINSGNGSGTNIQIPNLNIIKNLSN